MRLESLLTALGADNNVFQVKGNFERVERVGTSDRLVESFPRDSGETVAKAIEDHGPPRFPDIGRYLNKIFGK